MSHGVYNIRRSKMCDHTSLKDGREVEILCCEVLKFYMEVYSNI